MKRISIEKLLDDPQKMREFVDDMQQGAVAVIPTDTLYGFAVSSQSKVAVDRIYQIKNRDSRKPLILFLESIVGLDELGLSLNEKQRQLLNECWPGALTAVLPRPDSDLISAFSFATLGIRVPGHRQLQRLLAGLPFKLLTTSANRSGLPSDPDPEIIAREFSAEIDWLIDDGCLATNTASTVIDLTSEPFKILRAGAVIPKL